MNLERIILLNENLSTSMFLSVVRGLRGREDPDMGSRTRNPASSLHKAVVHLCARPAYSIARI